MIDNMDVDRILTERITVQSLPPHHSQLIHKLIAEATSEMKAIIREQRDLQYVKIWSENKTVELQKMLEKKTIEPATPTYIAIKQLSDAATHFLAEYRVSDRSIEEQVCEVCGDGSEALTSCDLCGKCCCPSCFGSSGLCLTCQAIPEY
jgi:hypothetical protein